MFRALILTVLSVFAVPALAETKEQKADRCAIQAGIVEAAISHRTEGRNQNRATKKILKSDPIKGSKYEANVDVLVAWIYSLPDAQLVPETVSTFETACLDYQ
ncbi:hypothetical protein SAMN06265173_10385 [Thalassovita litoralis]|jgi:hypothetical protein|uniref:HdeA/HdeB family protein n=1 Tax=Thalassovita litoralis TaxID=1010611 RepID=A0A521BJA6_9RHOB|nr:hypothetical protein [Thalassovita litoralis]SMO47228.1 hypothetical protein SAMN06265173_10385 [Thalassovita litoralis]